MTAPDQSGALLALQLSHQNESLTRIEKKLDTSLDDHEKRIRSLEASDRKWAAGVLAGSVLVNVLLKVLWP